MSDVQLLLVVVVALYLWECACWLKRGSVAFSSWLGRHWSLFHPGALVANQAGGFVLASPLPPLGTLLVANQFPLSLSSDGVLAFVSTNVNPGWRPAQTGRFVRFDEIKETQVDGRKVLINGELLVSCASPGLARYCGELLQDLAKLKVAQRDKAIQEHLKNSFDVEALVRRRKELQKNIGTVRALSNGLVVYIFVLIPAMIWNIGFKLTWLWLLLGLIALSSTTAFFFLRAHRKLYPKAEEERFTHTLTILLAPTTAMRAHDALSRPLLETFHPLTAAQDLLPKEEFREFARRILLDARNPALPRCPSEDADIVKTEAHARGLLQSQIESFLKRQGINPDELCRPAAPTDAAVKAYCPRCHAQFTTSDGTCADCGGLALVEFPKAEKRTT